MLALIPEKDHFVSIEASTGAMRTGSIISHLLRPMLRAQQRQLEARYVETVWYLDLVYDTSIISEVDLKNSHTFYLQPVVNPSNLPHLSHLEVFEAFLAARHRA